MKPLNVYWTGDVDFKSENNWNILFHDPEPLYRNVALRLNKDNPTQSFYECGAFKSLSKHTFIIRNPITSSYDIDENLNIVPKEGSLVADIPRAPTIENNILLRYWMPIIFFAEEEVVMNFTAPYFHNVKHSQYGVVTPGRYDISSWIRPVHLEFNLWEGVRKFQIQEGEPIAYVSFDTERKINLLKFNNSEEISRISRSCSSSSLWEPNVPLWKRYARFRESKMRDTVLKEIKKNVIGE